MLKQIDIYLKLAIQMLSMVEFVPLARSILKLLNSNKLLLSIPTYCTGIIRPDVTWYSVPHSHVVTYPYIYSVESVAFVD